MDASQPPTLLYGAVRLNCAEASRERRDEATLLFNLTCFGLAHGKDMSYWDVAGHLYPRDFIRRQRRREAEERQRAQQAQTLLALEAYAQRQRDKHA